MCSARAVRSRGAPPAAQHTKIASSEATIPPIALHGSCLEPGQQPGPGPCLPLRRLGCSDVFEQEGSPRETHAARGVRRRIPRTTKSWHHRGQCRQKPSLSGTCIPLCGALPGLQTQKIHLGEFREDSPTQPRGTRRRWHRATPLDHWGGRTDGTRPSRHQSAPWLLHSGLPSWFRPDLPRIRKRIN